MHQSPVKLLLAVILLTISFLIFGLCLLWSPPKHQCDTLRHSQERTLVNGDPFSVDEFRNESHITEEFVGGKPGRPLVEWLNITIRSLVKHMVPSKLPWQKLYQQDNKNRLHSQDKKNEQNQNDHYKRVCYYKLPVSDGADCLQPEVLDPFLCTHLILYSGAGVVNDTIDISGAREERAIQRAVSLKRRNPALRLLYSVMKGFPELVTNRTAVASFAFNARLFVERHGLDGLDLDWEFPAWSLDGTERKAFVKLVELLSTSLRLVEPAYLISIAVTAIQPILDHSYDMPRLASNVDYVCLMSYDYHLYQWYFPFTGHNAPLRPHPDYTGYLATLNVEWSVGALLQRGVKRGQLLVGVPAYGRTWRLTSPLWQALGAPASGPGLGRGYITYPGALAFLRSGGQLTVDTEAGVPYAARNRDWISFESVDSAVAKASWVRAKGLAGVMTFNLNSDDWSAQASEMFPLHAAMKRVLTNGSSGDGG